MNEALVVLAPWVLFFVVQITVNKEVPLTLVALAGSIFLVLHGGWAALILFVLGLMCGIFIEVILGIFLRTQHWEKASFFGVPYWLPLAWGYGFVVIHQLGETVLARLS